jgi:hypothetical protein
MRPQHSFNSGRVLCDLHRVSSLYAAQATRAFSSALPGWLRGLGTGTVQVRIGDERASNSARCTHDVSVNGLQPDAPILLSWWIRLMPHCSNPCRWHRRCSFADLIRVGVIPRVHLLRPTSLANPTRITASFSDSRYLGR